ncbi:hypothetical protein BD626DRAFT_400856 [Schizophyllum amplum]|uniref:Small RNA 2'-O-methyltransferase n=1 Tax=Schizophyllum amplum TaxID=97359 RepID=A0A550CHX3_9AGAR|nr:hypothetical protein BD626DRAFT_400856 [Auriculariopsis ampla]
MRVTFIPPLFLQRRVWILDILRQEKVTEVLDVGCGEGSLLGTLCQPAPWLDPPDAQTKKRLEIDPELEEVDVGQDDISNLHISRVVGLDLFTSEQDLDFAKLSIQPPPQDAGPYGYNSCNRFDPMRALLYRGGLEAINEDFVNMECIVATEVIEHLHTSVLPFFAPVIMGVYHPRLFLITTPNYTYNARFSTPSDLNSSEEVRLGGYPDPTERTNRVFRHSDHKFEWTEAEFQEYCTKVASEWGYDIVEMTGVGRAVEPDPWGREKELGSASFVCCFGRKDMPSDDRQDFETKARKLVQKLGTQHDVGSAHELVDNADHPADEAAYHPDSLDAIAASVTAALRDMGTRYVRLEELWFNKTISRICGGWLEMLVWAVERSPDLELRRREIDARGEDEAGRSYWHIEHTGLFSEPPTPLWPEFEHGEDGEGDTSLDLIPPDWEPSESEAWSSSTEGAEGDISGIEAGPSTFVRGPATKKRGDTLGTDMHGGWSSEDAELSPANGWEHQAYEWGDEQDNGWGSGWGWEDPAPQGKGKERAHPIGHPRLESSASSTTGWDGDQSDGSDTS